MEKGLVVWIEDLISYNSPLSLIQSKLFLILWSLREVMKQQNFKASRGWLLYFKEEAISITWILKVLYCE